VITHRRELAMEADRVVVIDQARVVETGRPADLLQHDGAFRRLFLAGAGKPDVVPPRDLSPDHVGADPA
jgi:ABC-type multidrug transport system fused ATPase/permease subunit